MVLYNKTIFFLVKLHNLYEIMGNFWLVIDFETWMLTSKCENHCLPNQIIVMPSIVSYL